MFYEVNQIDRFLTCPRCKKRFVEPKILPCGETICSYCANEMLVERKGKLENTFSCEICAQYHEIPKSGQLPTSKIILKLTEIKPNRVKRGKLVDTLEARLKNIKLQIDELNYEVNHGDEKISTHCSNLKNELKRATNEKLKEINKFSDALRKEIEKYETQCLGIFHTEIDTKQKVSQLIKEMSLFYRTWDDYLTSLDKFEKSELSKANGEAKQLERRFYQQREKLNVTMFNGRVLKYKKSGRRLEENVCGALHYQTDSAFFVEDLEKDDVKNLLIEFSQPTKHVTVEYLYKYPSEEKSI